MAVKTKLDADKPEKSERKFTKTQLLQSGQYRHEQDLLSALLEDGKTYALTEVEKLVQEFLEKEM